MRQLPLLVFAVLVALPACAEKEEPIDKMRNAVDDALDRRPAEQLRDAAEDASAAVKDAAGEVKEAAGEVKEAAGEVKEAAGEVKEAAVEMKDEVKQKLENAAR